MIASPISALHCLRFQSSDEFQHFHKLLQEYFNNKELTFREN